MESFIIDKYRLSLWVPHSINHKDVHFIHFMIERDTVLIHSRKFYAFQSCIEKLQSIYTLYDALTHERTRMKSRICHIAFLETIGSRTKEANPPLPKEYHCNVHNYF